MFSSLVSWLYAFFEGRLSWFRDTFSSIIDALTRWGHAWVWFVGAVVVCFGVLVDTMSWIGQFLDAVLSLILGVSIGSPLLSNHTFHAAYGLADYVVPVHEVVSMLVVLSGLWFVVNAIRLLRGVLSLVNVAGTGVNN